MFKDHNDMNELKERLASLLHKAGELNPSAVDEAIKLLKG